MLAQNRFYIRSAAAVLLLCAASAWPSQTRSRPPHRDQSRWWHRDSAESPRIRRQLGRRKRDHRLIHCRRADQQTRDERRLHRAGRRDRSRAAVPKQGRRRFDHRLAAMGGQDQAQFHRGDRRGRRPARRNDRPGRPRAFTAEEFAEEMERVQAFLEEHFPERLRELQAFRRDNPAGFQRRIGQMLPRMRRMMDMLERNPEAGKLMLREERLGFQIHRLVDRYFQATDSDRLAGLRSRIRELVQEQFEVRLKLRQQEVRRLERRLAAIKTKLQRDRDRREDRIEQSLEDLGVFED